jgi:hypothetical protein
MGTKDPNLAADKWAQNLANAAPSIKAGVAAVTVAPGQLAAAQVDVWIANTMAAKDKWAKRVGAVPLAEWQDKMTTLGISRIADGAQKAKPKMAAFLASFLPYVERGVVQMRSQYPRGTVEQNIARAVFIMRWNNAYQRPAGS